jgi:hypothetical protein
VDGESRRADRERKPLTVDRAAPAAADPRLAALGVPSGTGNRHIARWARTLSRETKEKEKRVTVYLGDPRPKPQPPPPVEALKRATPANRKVAELIDDLEKLSTADLLKARGEAAQGAVRPGYPSGQEQQQAKLNAIEFLVHRRGLGPLTISDDASRSDPTQRRLYVRMLIEQGLSKQFKARTGGSFKKALADFTHTKEIESDIEWFERDARIFRKEFTNQARENARKMLDASLEAMGGVLTSYGLQAGSAVRAAKEIYRGADAKEKAADLIRLAAMSKNVDAPKFQGKRKDLATTVKDLKNHQAHVRSRLKASNLADLKRPMSGSGPDWDYANAMNVRLAEARADLKTAWIEAEREHPILAAFRRGGDVEKVDLETLDKDPVEDEMRAVLLKVLPKMVDIIKVAYLIHIGPDQHGLSPLALPPVVAMTRANMFIPDGSIRAGVVKDMVDEASDDESWWVKVAAIALAIVTLIPSAGASAGLIGVAGASFAAYSAAHAWQQYDTQKSLANTDLDLARSLSTVEPTLTGFAVSLVALGMEGIPLISAFNKARKIKRLLNEGGNYNALVRELNADGQAYGTKNLGDQALHDAELANKRAAKEAAEREAAEREAAASVPKVPVKPPPLTVIQRFRSRAEFVDAVERKLTTAGTRRPPGWHLVAEALEATPSQINRQILEKLETVMDGLQNPKLYAEVLGDAWEMVKRNKAADINAALEAMAKASGLKVGKVGSVKAGGSFFKQVVSKKEYWIDHALAAKPHGEMSHLLQDLVVDRALGGPGKSAEFRSQLLANAEGTIERYVQRRPGDTLQPSHWTLLPDGQPVKNSVFMDIKDAGGGVIQETQMTTGDYVWRWTYDLFYDGEALAAFGRLPQPERLRPALNQIGVGLK